MKEIIIIIISNISIFGGGFWLIKKWIITHLEQSIKHEYSKIEKTIQHKLDVDLENYKKNFDKKVEIYSNLVNLAKSFMNDPTLDVETAIQQRKELVDKYNGLFQLYSSEKVRTEIGNFLDEVKVHGLKSISDSLIYVKPNEITNALHKLQSEMRKDLGFTEDSVTKNKIYSVYGFERQK